MITNVLILIVMRSNVKSSIVSGKTPYVLTMIIHAQTTKLQNHAHVYGINLTYVKNSLNVKIIQKMSATQMNNMDVRKLTLVVLH